MNLVKNFYKDITRENITNGFVAFLFAVTGPVAIMLLVGTKTDLTNQELSSWLFGAFAINSVISIVFSFWYKQPLVFMWSIPGIILIGSSIENYSFNEIVGTYVVTGIFLTFLGGKFLIVNHIIEKPGFYHPCLNTRYITLHKISFKYKKF